jgi:hypothetical protein
VVTPGGAGRHAARLGSGSKFTVASCAVPLVTALPQAARARAATATVATAPVRLAPEGVRAFPALNDNVALTRLRPTRGSARSWRPTPIDMQRR